MSPLPPECERLVQALERATARLAGRHGQDPEQALVERLHAIESLTQWIASEQRASRPASPLLATLLAKDLETGAEVLLRMTLGREAARSDLVAVNRGLQLLGGLASPAPAKPTTIDYRG